VPGRLACLIAVVALASSVVWAAEIDDHPLISR
jgi:hypothetical protein